MGMDIIRNRGGTLQECGMDELQICWNVEKLDPPHSYGPYNHVGL